MIIMFDSARDEPTAERELLGWMLLDGKVSSTSYVFQGPRNDAIYSAMLYLREHKVALDIVNLVARLDHLGQLEAVSVKYLADLTEGLPRLRA